MVAWRPLAAAAIIRRVPLPAEFPSRLTSLLARWACLVLLALALAPAEAQLPRLGASSAKPAEAEATRDPLDRGTPRRAITGFIRAAHRDNPGAAVRYVQAGKASPARAERMVRDLNELMDRHFHQPLSTISDAPEGSVDDGLPLDRERIGPLRIDGEEHFIELVRVDDPVVGKIWLVSSETFAGASALRASLGDTWVERLLPSQLANEAVFGFTWGDLVLWALSLALPLALLPTLLRWVHIVVRGVARTPWRRSALDGWFEATRTPLVLALTLATHGVAATWFGPTLSFRIWYSRLLVGLLVAALAWGVHRALGFAFRHAVRRLEHEGRGGTRSALVLGERLLNALLLLVVVLALLALVGVDIGTVLAGLGIVGVALALGAQKTIENVLGGVLLLGDEAIAVGDLCRVSNRLGVVEDITLRSVRFRTVEQTVLSIPAGVLAQAELENFASRNKILVQTRLRLAYGTPTERVRSVRDDVEALLGVHPAVEHATARVRLVEFGVQGIELELFAYLLTSDLLRFLSLREELLLDIAQRVESAGVAFAAPPWAPLAHPEPVPTL